LFYLSIFILIFISGVFNFGSNTGILITSCISILMIFIHEIFAVFFVPPLILILFYHSSFGRISFFKIGGLYILPVTIAFLMIYFNPGNQELMQAILDSLSTTDARNITGGIVAIGWKLEQSHNLAAQMISKGSSNIWMFYLLLNSIIAVVVTTILSRSFDEFALRIIILAWMVLAVCTSAYTGWDWGRWISIFGIGFPLLLGLTFPDTKILNEKITLSKLNFMPKLNLETLRPKIILICLILLITHLSVSTRMNHCCPHPSGLKLYSASSILGSIVPR